MFSTNYLHDDNPRTRVNPNKVNTFCGCLVFIKTNYKIWGTVKNSIFCSPVYKMMVVKCEFQCNDKCVSTFIVMVNISEVHENLQDESSYIRISK